MDLGLRRWHARRPTSQNPGSHTYTDPGTYTLSLTVDNAVGPPSTDAKTITVDPACPAARRRVAAFTASPRPARAALTVNLADTSTGGPTQWTWDFDDGTR